MKPPILTTERLLLRPPRPEDKTAVFSYAKDPEVSRFLPWSAHRTLEDTTAYFRMLQEEQSKGHMTWIIETLREPQVIGTFSLRPHDREKGQAMIAYALARTHWGQGYATEASIAVLRHARTLADHHQVCATVWPGNQASIRVLQRLGLRYVQDEHRDVGREEDRIVHLYALDLDRDLNAASSPGSP